MATIQEVVAYKISTSGPNIQEAVINKLAEVEISKRIDILTKAILKQDSLKKEFEKLDGKNDVTTYVNGSEVHAMSKNRFDEIKKHKEKMDSFNKLLEISLENNTGDSYKKLEEMLKKVENAGSGDKQ